MYSAVITHALQGKVDAGYIVAIPQRSDAVELASFFCASISMLYDLDLHQTLVHLAAAYLQTARLQAALAEAASPPAEAAAPVNNNYSYAASYPYFSSKKKS